MKLVDIKKINEHLSPDDFLNDYYNKKVPVILDHFLADKTMLSKWNFDFLAEQAGDQMVEVYGSEDSHNEWVTSPPLDRIPFKKYLDIINNESTPSRLFLFNLLSKKPSLKKDLKIYDVTGGKVIT